MGSVTAARLCEINGEFKLFLLRGEPMDTKRTTCGVMANVRLERPVQEVLETIWNAA